MVNTKTDNKKYDVLLYVYSVLKRLGCGDVNTFEQRLKSQKTQYFAQLFGVSLRYSYNLYLNGPYSPTLAQDLYHIKEFKMKPMLEEFIPEELEQRFKDLKTFMGDMTARQLELSATYHWLLRVADLGKNAAKKKLAELKNSSESELIYAINKLKQYEQIKKSYN